MSSAAPEVEKRRRRVKIPRSSARRLRRLRPTVPRRLTAAFARVGAKLPPDWTGPRLTAAVVLIFVLIVAVLATPVTHLLGLKGASVRDPAALNLFGNPTGPSSSHPLGVDAEGRDVLSRILSGLHSMMLLGLAGAGIAAAVGWALTTLALLNRWVEHAVRLVLAALASFPPLLLGLALGLTLGPGCWRLIVAIAVAVIVPIRGRELLTWAPMLLRNALALDVTLTFLGDGPGGSGAQLGASIAQAGEGVVNGVPAWWALLFPGLVALLVIAAGSVLVPPRPAAAPHLLRLWSRNRRGYIADALSTALARAVIVCALAAAMFTGLGGNLHDIGSALAPSVSLLAGGLVIWALVILIQVRLGTRAHVRDLHAPDRLARLPALIFGAAPAGWLAFLALYLFSDSVGKLPLLPGAHGYSGLTHDPGRWIQSLIIPWLLMGLYLAARTAPTLRDAILAGSVSGQQRVARAAGVSEIRLSRQRRRALAAPVLELVRRQLTTVVGVGVLIEAVYGIPGVGGLSVSDFGHADTVSHAADLSHIGMGATVANATIFAALVVVLLAMVLDVVRVLIDPQVATHE